MRTLDIPSFTPPRLDALRTLGTEIPAEVGAHRALELAGLAGWGVHKRPLETATLWTPLGGTPEITQALTVPDHYATVREIDGRVPEVLGVVGRTYTVIQNEEHVDLLDTIVDESSGSLSSAGAMRGGRDVFISIKLPDTITVGGVDPVDQYLVAFNSHDGGSAFKLAVTNIRVFCSNQQAAVFKGASASYSIRHTSGARGLMAQARDALGVAFKYDSLFELEAEKMIQQTMDDAAFHALVSSIWEEPTEKSSKAAVTMSENRTRTLEELFHDSPTNRNIRGTVWAGYQALTEYTDHFAPAVLGKHSNTLEEARALRTLTGDSAHNLKARAFNACRDLVSA